MISVKKINENIVQIKSEEVMTNEDFDKILTVITKLLEIGKKFSFIIDAYDTKKAPIKRAFMIIKWMKEKKPQLKDILISSCVITRYKVLANVLNKVFKYQKPTRPNLITASLDKAMEFSEGHVEEYLKNKGTNESTHEKTDEKTDEDTDTDEVDANIFDDDIQADEKMNETSGNK